MPIDDALSELSTKKIIKRTNTYQPNQYTDQSSKITYKSRGIDKRSFRYAMLGYIVSAPSFLTFLTSEEGSRVHEYSGYSTALGIGMLITGMAINIINSVNLEKKVNTSKITA
jgi:hypothetical protein